MAFLFCVTILFSFSFGPVSWTYMSEVLPYQVRSKGAAFATGIGNWLVATFWAQVSPTALDKLGWKFYFLFVGTFKEAPPRFCFVFFFFATKKKERKKEKANEAIAWDLIITLPCLILLFKETKGLSLEEIDVMFGGRALGTLDDDMEKNTVEANEAREEELRAKEN